MANDDGSKNEASGVIKSVSREARRFPPSKQFAQRALIKDSAAYAKQYRRSIRRPRGVLGRDGQGRARLVQAVGQGARLEAAVRQVVRRRRAQRLGQLPRPPLRRRAATRPRSIWEGEPGDEPQCSRYQDLHARSASSPTCSRALGVEEGRRRRDLHADDPRAGHRDAGLRADRRRRTRWSSAASAPRRSPTASRTARPRCCITADGGWRRGKVVPLKAQRRRRRSTRRRPSKSVSSCAAPATTSRWRPGRDNWWHEQLQGVSADCPPEPLDSEHPLFILYTSGSTGKPKGILHTTGGYLLGAHADHQVGLRPQRGRHLLVHRRRRLGHRALLRRLRPARQRRDLRDVRGRARLARRGALLEDHRGHRVTILYTAPTAIRAFMKWGDELPEEARPVEPAPAGHASASRSTPRPGCGTTRSSAAAAARSSTPGGRPRPARS